MVPRRRVAAGLTAVAVALIVVGATAVLVAGVGGGGGIPTGNAGPSASPPASASFAPPGTPTFSARPVVSSSGFSTPSAVVSASPIPGPSQRTTGFAQVGDALVYFADDGSIVPVPKIDGLDVKVQKGQAVYTANATNPFGLRSGAYAGQFVPAVSTGQADGSNAVTGGVVLVGTVVAALISDELATSKSDGNLWIVALPVDIRSTTAAVQVSFDDFGSLGTGNAPRVQVRFSGTLPIVEMIPENAGYHVLVEGLGSTVWQVIDPTRLGLPTDSIDPAHAMNELVVYGNSTPTLDSSAIRRDILHDGRVPLGQTMIDATGSLSVSLAVAGSHLDLGPDKILTIGDVPVFVASS